MPVFTIPKVLREKLDNDGADALADILSQLEKEFKNDVIETVSLRFEKLLIEENGKIRNEMLEFKKEILDFKNEMLDFRKEMLGKFEDIHKQFVEVHKAITTQTKWILVIFLGTATFISLVLPFTLKMADKVFQ